MTALKLAVLRHGPTLWNAEGRMQGRSDIALSPEGRAVVAAWRLPFEIQGFDVITSPLMRARETAVILGFPTAASDPRLIETDWGDWEGQRLAELRQEGGEDFIFAEARGLDFTPPGGESPRMVQQRLKPLLVELAAKSCSTLLISHKGIVRALYALATGWPMVGKLPHRLDNGCVHLFHLQAGGRLSLDRTNLSLTTP